MKIPDNNPKPVAIVLLSGGLDSATVLAIAVECGFDIVALSFQYGQRHAIEVECAAKLAQSANVLRHVVITLDLGLVGGSALTDTSISVPKHESSEQIGSEIPITYVPARNTLFLTYALAWAEVTLSGDIFIGVNALDYSGYPDCRPEFIVAFETMANLATKVGVETLSQSNGKAIRIHAPLIDLTKAQIIERGLSLGVDYAKTFSCYDPSTDGRACGHCDSCLLRQSGFRQNGQSDPIQYTQQ